MIFFEKELLFDKSANILSMFAKIFDSLMHCNAIHIDLMAVIESVISGLNNLFEYMQASCRLISHLDKIRPNEQFSPQP